MDFERERRDKEKEESERAGIKPTAAAHRQSVRLDVSRSDHSAGSKGLVTSFKATVRTDTVYVS